MSATNSFHIIGNLTRDAELKYINTGTAVCSFPIAANKTYKKDGTKHEDVSYFDCSLWGKLGESINQYLIKGTLVAMDGELKQDRWEKDGQVRTAVKLIVDDIHMLPSGKRSGEGQGASRASSPQPRAESPQGPAQAHAVGDDFTDDIPF